MLQRLAVALLAGLVYVNALHNPFIYDDYSTVVGNASIVPPVSLRAVVLHDVKRPIVNASYALDRGLWGPRPAGFHATNVAIHVVNVLLLFQLASALFRAGRENERAGTGWGAFGAAALFAVHPMMTEAVGYISGRSELLCATFVLAALLCGVRWMRRGGAVWVMWTLTFWVAALLSKETAAVLPLLLVACDAFTAVDRESFGKRLKTFHLPLIAFSVAAGIVRLVVLTRVEYPGDTRVHPDLVPLALDVIVRYSRLMVVPTGQTLFHSVTLIAPFGPRALTDYAILAALLSVAWTVRHQYGVASFGIVTFLLLLAPAALLTILNRGEPMAEHRVYVASTGWFLAAGSIVVAVHRRARAAIRLGAPLVAVATSAVIIAFAAETMVRNALWSDPVALWKESAALAPHHPRPRLMLGEALEDGGRRREALVAYQAAVQLGPSDPAAHLKLALCLAALARFDEARAELHETLRLDPGNAAAQRSLSLLTQIKPAS